MWEERGRKKRFMNNATFRDLFDKKRRKEKEMMGGGRSGSSASRLLSSFQSEKLS